ncbi:MAG: serine/threonine-protein kinase [Polyangiaceae bacterium]
MSEPDPLIGRVIDGRYRIAAKVGAGGFGIVYEAEHLALGARVALKVLRVPANASPERREDRMARFMDEGRVLPRLRHPNIVAALDLGQLPADAGPPTPYLVMEWCAGSTLQAALGRAGAFALADAWLLFEPVVDAMAFAHGMGVVHRDLKPANVMLDEVAGRTIPRVIDFGIAKVVEDAVHDGGLDSTMACTPAYAAPEQLVGEGTGPWTDVHALALLFVELVSGRPPFGDNARARADLRALRPSPGVLGIDVGAFEPVIARALALNADDRHVDAAELGKAMREAARAMGMNAGQTLAPASAAFVPGRHTPAPGSPPPAGWSGTDGSGTPDGATRTLSTGTPGPTGTQVRPRAARRGLWMAIAGAVIVAVAIPSLWLISRRGAQGNVPPPPPPAETSAPGPAAPARLADLTLVELERRITATGIQVVSRMEQKDALTVSWIAPSNQVGTAMTMRFPAMSLPPAEEEAAVLRYVGSMVRGYKSAGGGVAWAVEDHLSIVLWQPGSHDDAARRLDAALFGMLGLRRGTGAEGDAALEAVAQPPPEVKVRASTLSELTSEELELRARETGAQVQQASHSGQRWGSLMVHDAGQYGTLVIQHWYPASLDGLRSSPYAFAWVRDGDTLIWGNGLYADAAVLRKVLSGLEADVHHETGKPVK